MPLTVRYTLCTLIHRDSFKTETIHRLHYILSRFCGLPLPIKKKQVGGGVLPCHRLNATHNPHFCLSLLTFKRTFSSSRCRESTVICDFRSVRSSRNVRSSEQRTLSGTCRGVAGILATLSALGKTAGRTQFRVCLA